MMNQRERNSLDRHITGNYGEDQFKGDDPLMTEADWTAVHKARAAELSEAPLGRIAEAILRQPDYVAFQLANDVHDLSWLVVSPEFEEEIAGPFATREECDRAIENLNTAKAEAHADPYPDRIFPECEMN